MTSNTCGNCRYGSFTINSITREIVDEDGLCQLNTSEVGAAPFVYMGVTCESWERRLIFTPTETLEENFVPTETLEVLKFGSWKWALWQMIFKGKCVRIASMPEEDFLEFFEGKILCCHKRKDLHYSYEASDPYCGLTGWYIVEPPEDG